MWLLFEPVEGEAASGLIGRLDELPSAIGLAMCSESDEEGEA